MAEKDQEKPKIIVDDDWKAQAEAEKEKLSEQVEHGQGAQREIPPASLSTLVSFLATQALMALGGFQDPKTKQRYVDLELAKHYVDTLAVLEEKTKGNLSEEEKRLLDQVIYEVRMNYVEIAQRLSQM